MLYQLKIVFLMKMIFFLLTSVHRNSQFWYFCPTKTLEELGQTFLVSRISYFDGAEYVHVSRWYKQEPGCSTKRVERLQEACVPWRRPALLFSPGLINPELDHEGFRVLEE